MLSQTKRMGLLATFSDRCRAAGLVTTFHRQTVYETLLEQEDHPTADAIFDAVKTKLPQISRSSVFRILETLTTAGLIARVMHPGSVARYDGVADGHTHLICTCCGAMSDWHELRFDHDKLPGVAPDGFRIDGVALCCYGLCKKCRQESK